MIKTRRTPHPPLTTFTPCQGSANLEGAGGVGLCGREDTQKGLGIAGQVCQTRQNKTRQGKKKSTWLCFGFLFVTFPTADLVCMTLAEIPEEESPRWLPAGMASPKQAFGHLPTRGRCSPSNHPISTFSSQGRPTGSKPGG